MPTHRCACPSCHRIFRIPDDVIGRTSTCPGCKSSLIVKTVGGKTTLALAGVDANAPTQTVPPLAPPRVTQAPRKEVASSPRLPQRRRPALWLIGAVGCLGLTCCGGVTGIGVWWGMQPTGIKAAKKDEFPQRSNGSDEEPDYNQTVSVSEWQRDYGRLPGSPIETTAISLIQEFEENPLVADKKNWKKKLRIVGEVNKIGMDGKFPYVEFYDPSLGSRQMHWCRCVFRSNDEVSHIRTGQGVVLEGLGRAHKFGTVLVVGRRVSPR